MEIEDNRLVGLHRLGPVGLKHSACPMFQGVARLKCEFCGEISETEVGLADAIPRSIDGWGQVQHSFKEGGVFVSVLWRTACPTCMQKVVSYNEQIAEADSVLVSYLAEEGSKFRQTLASKEANFDAENKRLEREYMKQVSAKMVELVSAVPRPFDSVSISFNTPA